MSIASPRILPGISSLVSWLRPNTEQSTAARGVWAVGDQAVISLASFLATVIIGRYCSPAELGIYVLAAGVFWVLVGFPNALIWMPYTARAPHLAGRRLARYTGSAVAHLGAVLLCVLVGLGFAAVVLPWLGEMLGYSLAERGRAATVCLALVPFSMLMMVREHVRRMFTAHLQMQEMLLVDLPIAVVQIALLWTLAQFGWLSAETGLLAIAAACLISAVSMLLRRGELSFRPRLARLHFVYNFRFGRWLLLGSIAWLVSEQSYRLLVWFFSGLDSLGQMGAALYIVMLVNPLLISISYFARALMANRLADAGPTGMHRVVLRWTVGSAALFGPLLAILAFVGGTLVTTIYGDAYAGQGLVVAAFCLAMLFRALVVPADAALTAARHGRPLAAAAVVQLLLALGTGVPLAYAFGPLGAACAMAISDGGSLLLRGYFASQIDWTSASRVMGAGG